MIEIYTARPVKRVANTVEGVKSRPKQYLAGSVVIAQIDPKRGRIAWSGAGTVKIIPVSRRTLKGIARDLKRESHRRAKK